MASVLRPADFLNGVEERLRPALPAAWREFASRRQGHLLKIWYREPTLHYEVWPVAGRGLIEVGLHFEAAPAINMHLLDWFDPHMIELAAAVDGMVELEQWTPSWGHVFHVFHAATLDTTVQTGIVGWLGRFIPVAEPILQAALAEIGPVTTQPARSRDWNAWRQRQRRRTRLTAEA